MRYDYYVVACNGRNKRYNDYWHARAVAERLRRLACLRRRGLVILKRCEYWQDEAGKYHITPYILMSFEQ